MRIRSLKLSERDKNRFWNRVKCTKSDECWEWQGSRGVKGYGQFYLNRNGCDTTVRTYRAAFVLENGDTDLLVCHRCNNPARCNPSHLYAGSHSANTKQSVQERRHVDNSGERHGNSKLTKKDVVKILNLR